MLVQSLTIQRESRFCSEIFMLYSRSFTVTQNHYMEWAWSSKVFSLEN